MQKGAGFLGRNRFKKEETPELPDPESFTMEKTASAGEGVDEALEQSETDGMNEVLGQTAEGAVSETDLVEQIKTAKAEAIAKLPKENAEERRKVNERRRLILIGCGAAAVIVIIAGVILYNVNTRRTGENVSLPEVANINSGTTSTQAVDLAKLRAEADRVLNEKGLLAASIYYSDQLERTKNPASKYNQDGGSEDSAEVIEGDTEEATTEEDASVDENIEGASDGDEAEANAGEDEGETESADTGVEIETDFEASNENEEDEVGDEEGSDQEEVAGGGYQYNITKTESMSDRAAIWMSYANFLYDYLHSDAANSLTTAPEDGSEYIIGVESREYWNEALLSAAAAAEKTYPCRSTAEAYAKYLREYRSDDPLTADYYEESAKIRTR